MAMEVTMLFYSVLVRLPSGIPCPGFRLSILTLNNSYCLVHTESGHCLLAKYFQTSGQCNAVQYSLIIIRNQDNLYFPLWTSGAEI